MLESSLNGRKLTVLCYGDSNTWGAIPGPLNPATGLPYRFTKDQRWGQINGLQFLPFILETHNPIDVVIFYLGTNDTKTKFNCPVEEIAENMRRLIRLVTNSTKGFNGSPPHVMLLAPPSILKNTKFYPQFDQNSIVKSQQLASAYQKISQEERCAFFDLGEISRSSEIDGVHLDLSQHLAIGKNVALRVLKFF